ncbi:MAG: DUF2157 domain-containing protein [Pseudomonadota bacterium]
MSTQTEAENALLQRSWPLALGFGAAQVIAGIIFFFAYNWRDLPDVAKIALPQCVLVAAFLVWVAFPGKRHVARIAGIVASAMIGVSMAVVGQVYQLGADPWRLFATWAALVFVIAAATRDDAQFVFSFAIATIAYFLYTDQEVAQYLQNASTKIYAVYVVLGVVALLFREFLGAGAPPWVRRLLVASVLVAAVSGGLTDILARSLFDNGFYATLALFCAVCLFVWLYRSWRPDAPSCAMALFSAAAYLGVLGPRFLFTVDLDGSVDVAGRLLLSAMWILGLTAGLAHILRRFLKSPERFG